MNDLLAAGVNGTADWKGCLGRSLLYTAVPGGKCEVLSALLKAGAQPDVNVCSGEKQRSPLYYAVSSGHGAIVKLLLITEVDVGCVDGDQNSPLHVAVRAASNKSYWTF